MTRLLNALKYETALLRDSLRFAWSYALSFVTMYSTPSRWMRTCSSVGMLLTMARWAPRTMTAFTRARERAATRSSEVSVESR